MVELMVELWRTVHCKDRETVELLQMENHFRVKMERRLS